MDNVSSPPPSWATPGLFRAGASRKVNWCPPHRRFPGNDAADEAGPGGHPTTSGGLDCLTQHPWGKVLTRRAAVCAAEQQYRQLGADIEAGSLAQTSHEHNEPLRPPPAAVPSQGVVLHRLRLGYLTLEDLRDGFEGRANVSTVLI
ncbi:hypothetical protein GWK47_014204 [Chionoecetes opilio]|uniref:Uncharacterized protein n=1 Tax=Chionoecetes opilio TaxID=41210 RepID=A0A8J5C0P5_CHIOP|nr:hypothetical protein GWK47_014204 [Chionoecetes opilio]